MQRIALFLCVIAAVLAGFLLTLRSITPQAARVSQHLGAWQFAPFAGTNESDPYVRARLFLSGELPVASGQGYAVRAYRDSQGQVLDRRCAYSLGPPFPHARYWTLTLTDRDGRILANPLERHSFTSSEIVRHASGAFDILIGPAASTGNWLPTGGLPGTFVLDLRFYDTPLSATATQLTAGALPQLVKQGCPP